MLSNSLLKPGWACPDLSFGLRYIFSINDNRIEVFLWLGLLVDVFLRGKWEKDHYSRMKSSNRRCAFGIHPWLDREKHVLHGIVSRPAFVSLEDRIEEQTLTLLFLWFWCFRSFSSEYMKHERFYNFLS